MLHHVVAVGVQASANRILEKVLSDALHLRRQAVLQHALDNSATVLVPRGVGHGPGALGCKLVDDEVQAVGGHHRDALLEHVVGMWTAQSLAGVPTKLRGESCPLLLAVGGFEGGLHIPAALWVLRQGPYAPKPPRSCKRGWLQDGWDRCPYRYLLLSRRQLPRWRQSRRPPCPGCTGGVVPSTAGRRRHYPSGRRQPTRPRCPGPIRLCRLLEKQRREVGRPRWRLGIPMQARPQGPSRERNCGALLAQAGHPYRRIGRLRRKRRLGITSLARAEILA
mmetsp:Transcript_64644/g.142581  ORF Transcript_64644/g.142581 Transcript_64644/m.142581 type:complete len:279 (-) Transcript_64644:7-843(-)